MCPDLALLRSVRDMASYGFTGSRAPCVPQAITGGARRGVTPGRDAGHRRRRRGPCLRGSRPRTAVRVSSVAVDSTTAVG